MKAIAGLSPDEWVDAGLPAEPETHTRRAFVSRGCAVFDADFEPPPGWVHVERDDGLGWFESDEQAAANVAPQRWAWYCPATKTLSPACGAHASEAEGMYEPFPRTPDGGRDGWHELLGRWFDARDAALDNDPPCGVRVVVPIEDAIDAGLLTADACRTCGLDEPCSCLAARERGTS